MGRSSKVQSEANRAHLVDLACRLFAEHGYDAVGLEEVATAAGISIATLTRRLREGLDADEVMRAARHVGASPTEALMALGMLEPDDVRTVAAVEALDTVPEVTLLEQLLERARGRADAEDADREEAGLPPAPPARFVPRVVEVSDVDGTLADAADDHAGWDVEDEERERD